MFKLKYKGFMEKQENDTLNTNNEGMESTSEQINSGNEAEVSSDSSIEVEARIKELELKLNESSDKYLRLMAEFDNFRRRVFKEKEELRVSAGKDIFKNVLPVVDDFERAIAANENAQDLKSLSDGFHLIYKQMKNFLSQGGVTELEISKGSDFNSDTMEAITNFVVEEVELKGKVVDVLEKGYMLNGNVIRFAKVIIGA
jgi:molecular chaperone GrpE